MMSMSYRRSEKSINAVIGEKMKSLREEKQISMQEVARRLKVSKSAVHYWESGKRNITVQNFISYCYALGYEKVRIELREGEHDRELEIL